MYMTDEVARALFLSSVNKNMERMIEAHTATTHVYDVMDGCDPVDQERERLEEELQEQMAHLKSAQNALKKAINDKTRQLRTEQDVDRQEAGILITDSPTRLSEDEMAMVVHTFINESYQDTIDD